MPVELGGRLQPAPADELVVVDRQLEAVRAHVVGEEQRELRAGPTAAVMPSSRAARSASSASMYEPVVLGGDQLVAAERRRIDDLDAVRGDVDGVEHRDRGDAAAVVLQVEERVADPGRDLVEERRRRLGRRVDQDGDGITSSRASTSGTWRT